MTLGWLRTGVLVQYWWCPCVQAKRSSVYTDWDPLSWVLFLSVTYDGK